MPHLCIGSMAPRCCEEAPRAARRAWKAIQLGPQRKQRHLRPRCVGICDSSASRMVPSEQWHCPGRPAQSTRATIPWDECCLHYLSPSTFIILQTHKMTQFKSLRPAVVFPAADLLCKLNRSPAAFSSLPVIAQRRLQYRNAWQAPRAIASLRFKIKPWIGQRGKPSRHEYHSGTPRGAHTIWYWMLSAI